MERMESQFRKYPREIKSLEQENSCLENKLDANKPSVKDKLEAGKLQQEMQFLRQFYATVPDEYKESYRAAQQKKSPTQKR